MGKKRSLRYMSWLQGRPPLEDKFIERHAELYGMTYEEAYNEVYRVMRTTQDMLLTNKRFMLPGIGIAGIATNPKRGLVIASSTMWFSPGLLTVVAKAPGWENAPLNTYLTKEHVDGINKIMIGLGTKKCPTLTTNQFYNASDLGVEGVPRSDEKFDYYVQAASKRWTFFRHRLNVAKMGDSNDKVQTSDS